MKTDLILLILIMTVFIAYTGYIYLKYGITSSISSSIHKLDTPLKKSLYSFFMIGISVPLMIVSNNELGWWSGALLAIDAAAPAGGDKFQNKLHCFGAQFGMLLGMLMLGIEFDQWILVFITAAFVAVLYFRKFKNRTWWIETFVFIAAIIGLFIEKIL